jgi:Zn-dependent alcohol dehydrogenase
MKTMAAALLKAPGDWEVVEVDLAPPQQDELLVRMGAAGLCHSDDHITSGDLQVPPGASRPARDIPAMLDLYRQGRLKLDELITARYALTQVNQGYQDMRDGRNIRGIITFD